ncbi:MAG: rhodanese-like domain-containing protein [Actinomycetota bacterium]
MPRITDRNGVQALMKRGAQLVEVLPAKEFEAEHISGAINIPLAEVPRRMNELDPTSPIIVYCEDYQCDLSPRAAVRLELLGFKDVYDYAAGKVDWKASGLPTEGTEVDTKTIGRMARRDVPTCRMDERVSDVAERMRATGWDIAVVLAEGDIVVGEIDRRIAEEHPREDCGNVMKEGPSTYRANVPIDEIEPKLKKTDYAIVSTTSGELLGVFERQQIVETRREEAMAGSR